MYPEMQTDLSAKNPDQTCGDGLSRYEVFDGDSIFDQLQSFHSILVLKKPGLKGNGPEDISMM